MQTLGPQQSDSSCQSVHGSGDEILSLFDAGLQFGQRLLNHLFLVCCQLPETQILLQSIFLSIARKVVAQKERERQSERGISHQAESESGIFWHGVQEDGDSLSWGAIFP